MGQAHHIEMDLALRSANHTKGLAKIYLRMAWPMLVGPL